MMLLLLVLLTSVAPIQEAIEAEEAEWVAVENKFTGMEDKSEYVLAEKPSNPSVLDIALYAPEQPALEVSFDWHNLGGEDWMTPVRDQGGCGSCWAFGTLGAVEAAYNISVNDPDYDLDLSEQYVISCMPGGCSGSIVEPIMQRMTVTGVPPESCMPYVGKETPCLGMCDSYEADLVSIAAWRWVLPPLAGGEEGVKYFLTYGPIVSSMEIYEDFWAYESGVYEHVYGGSEGFHVVVIVGWDDATECWIAKNSWGEDWGEDGYFRIKRGEAGLGLYGVQPYVKEEDVPEIDYFKNAGCSCGFVY